MGSSSVFPAAQDYLPKLPSGGGVGTSAEAVSIDDYNKLVDTLVSIQKSLLGTGIALPAAFFALNPPIGTAASPIQGIITEWGDGRFNVKSPLNPSGAAKMDGVTDDTASFTAAWTACPAAGGKITLGAGAMVCATAVNPKSNVTVEGLGIGSQILFTGTGRFFDYSVNANVTQVRFRNVRVSCNANGAVTLFYASFVFRNTWEGCIIDGTHSSGAQRPNQIGFEFRANAGDNRIVNCDIDRFGKGIATSSIMNYLVASVIGSCKISIHGDAGSVAAGMSVSDVTLVSNAATTDYHVLVDVTANKWWFTNVWAEGCGTAMSIGTGANGPYSFGIVNGVLAGTTADLVINASTYTLLENIALEADPAQTPTELTINGTNALEGTAVNLRSFQGFDFADTVFPVGWSVLRRGAMRGNAVTVRGGLTVSASGADVTGAVSTFRAPASTNLAMAMTADAAQTAAMKFQAAGADKWVMTRETDNSLTIYDNTRPGLALQLRANGNFEIMSAGGGVKIAAAAGLVGFYNVTPVVKAGAITAPNAQTASYVQADVTSLKTAIDAIRTALTNIGITA